MNEGGTISFPKSPLTEICFFPKMAFFCYGLADLIGGVAFGVAADSLSRRSFYLLCTLPLLLWAGLSLTIEGTCGTLLESSCGGVAGASSNVTATAAATAIADAPLSRNAFLALSVGALSAGGVFHAALVTWQAVAFGEMFTAPGPGATCMAASQFVQTAFGYFAGFALQWILQSASGVAAGTVSISFLCLALALSAAGAVTTWPWRREQRSTLRFGARR